MSTNQHLNAAGKFNWNTLFSFETDERMSAAREPAAKRWCFTINNPTDDDKFWENAEQQEQLEFLAVQYEIGKQGTPHYQGFLILKRKNRLTWVRKNMNGRAHWEKTRGTDLEAYQYCMKDDTHPEGSYRWRWGTLKECLKRKDRDELEEAVIDEVKTARRRFQKCQRHRPSSVGKARVHGSVQRTHGRSPWSLQT